MAMFHPICQEIVECEAEVWRVWDKKCLNCLDDRLEYDEVSVEMLRWESVLCRDVLLGVMFAASCHWLVVTLQ